MKPSTSHLGKNIKTLLDRNDLDADLLAGKCGVTSATVRRWIANTVWPKREKLDEMAEFFGVPVTKFFIEDLGADNVDGMSDVSQKDLVAMVRSIKSLMEEKNRTREIDDIIVVLKQQPLDIQNMVRRILSIAPVNKKD